LFSFGKTPPVPIAHWISGKEIVVANGDTNPLVGVTGYRKLRMQSGSGDGCFLEKEGYELTNGSLPSSGNNVRKSS